MTAACETAPETLRGCYARDGYVVVPGLISADALAELRSEIARIFSLAAGGQAGDPYPDIESVVFNKILRDLFENRFEAYHGAARLCNHAVSLHRLSTDPAIQSLMRSLGVAVPAICARPVVWFHSPALARSERYHRLPAHQEWSNMQGSIDGMVVWLPLLLVTAEMGRLQVVPGSHRDGLRPLLDEAGDDYPLSMDMGGLSDTDFVEVDVPLGAALLFSPFLVHRSGTNRTERARITANFRFNNAADPSFIARNMANPFLYEAPTSLVTPGLPDAAQVRGYFETMLQESE